MIQGNDDPERESLTRFQIEILRGRKISELSPLEKLQFANAAPRTVPAKRHIADADRFKISLSSLEGADPIVKLNVANGAQRIGEIRQKRRQIRVELSSNSDPSRRNALQYEDEILSKEGAAIFAQIGRYEDRAGPAAGCAS